MPWSYSTSSWCFSTIFWYYVLWASTNYVIKKIIKLSDKVISSTLKLTESLFLQSIIHYL